MRPRHHRSHLRDRVVAVGLIATSLAITLVPAASGTSPGAPWAGTSLGGVDVTHVAVNVGGEVGSASTAAVDVPNGSTIVVVTWTGDKGAEFVVQTMADGSILSTYDGLIVGGDDADEGAVLQSRFAAGPVWLDPDTEAVRVVRRQGAAVDVRLDFLAVPDRPVVTGSAGLNSSAIDVGALPPIRPNEDWGNPGWVFTNEDCELGPATPGYLDRAAIHHTVNTNTYPASAVDDLLLGIYYLHTNINGWCDIGYNFIIDRFGTIWEARRDSIEKPIQGGHTSGINPGSVGIALLGTHHPGLTFPATAPRAGVADQIAAIVSVKFSEAGADPAATVQVGVKNDEYVLHGQRLTVPAIYGHRQVEATSCPGDLAIGLVSEVQNLVHVTRPANPTVLINNAHSDGEVPALGTVDLGNHELLVGDWNGDGTDTFGYYESPFYYLWNSMHSTEPDLIVKYGRPGDTALVGDWDGDGDDTIGIRRANVLHLRNTNDPGPADHTFSFGRRHDEVLIGDWDGDDTDTVGTRRGNIIYLNNAFRSGNADITYGYGKANDNVVVGDWDGDRRDTLGVRRGSTMFFGNRTISGPADLVYEFADPDTHVEYGDWNGDWITTPLVIVD